MVDFLVFIPLDFFITLLASLRYLVSLCLQTSFQCRYFLYISTSSSYITGCLNCNQKTNQPACRSGFTVDFPSHLFLRLLLECFLLHMWSKPCLQTWVGLISYSFLSFTSSTQDIVVGIILTRLERHHFGRVPCHIDTGALIVCVHCLFLVSHQYACSARKQVSPACLLRDVGWLSVFAKSNLIWVLVSLMME